MEVEAGAARDVRLVLAVPVLSSFATLFDMARILYNTTTAQFLPYPRLDDQPVIGLDPSLLVLDLIQLEAPSYDPATHRLELTETIDLQAGTVTRGWQAVPLPPAPPAPDWDQFRQALQTENGFPSAWLAAFQANPQVAGLVASRLDLYQLNGNYQLFIQALLAALATLSNQAQAAEVAVEFAALAERCNMPAEFLEELDRKLLGSPG